MKNENIIYKMICTHFEENENGEQIYPPCGLVATHYSCNNGPKEQIRNACEKHKCRCKQPT